MVGAVATGHQAPGTCSDRAAAQGWSWELAPQGNRAGWHLQRTGWSWELADAIGHRASAAHKRELLPPGGSARVELEHAGLGLGNAHIEDDARGSRLGLTAPATRRGASGAGMASPTLGMKQRTLGQGLKMRREGLSLGFALRVRGVRRWTTSLGLVLPALGMRSGAWGMGLAPPALETRGGALGLGLRWPC